MKVHRTLRFGGAFALLAGAVLFFSGPSLPEPNDVEPPVLRSEPLQRKISAQVFTKMYGDIIYTYTPCDEYEVSGVIVSLDHSDSFIDITHVHDPVNTLDLCLAMGENVRSDVYRKVEYIHRVSPASIAGGVRTPGFAAKKYPTRISFLRSRTSRSWRRVRASATRSRYAGRSSIMRRNSQTGGPLAGAIRV